MEKNEESLSVELSSLSHSNLVELIGFLENSPYSVLRKKAQKELVRRLKEKGFDNKSIAKLLVSNVYGRREKILIAKEWAEALEISSDAFLKLIGGK